MKLFSENLMFFLWPLYFPIQSALHICHHIHQNSLWQCLEDKWDLLQVKMLSLQFPKLQYHNRLCVFYSQDVEMIEGWGR